MGKAVFSYFQFTESWKRFVHQIIYHVAGLSSRWAGRVTESRKHRWTVHDLIMDPLFLPRIRPYVEMYLFDDIKCFLLFFFFLTDTCSLAFFLAWLFNAEISWAVKWSNYFIKRFSSVRSPKQSVLWNKSLIWHNTTSPQIHHLHYNVLRMLSKVCFLPQYQFIWLDTRLYFRSNWGKKVLVVSVSTRKNKTTHPLRRLLRDTLGLRFEDQWG